MNKFSGLTDAFYQDLIEHLPDGICVIEEGRTLYANQQMATLLGTPVKELVGRSFIEFIAAEDHALVLERYRARICGESVPEQYDIRLVTVQGSQILCTLNIALMQTSTGQTVTIASIRDVTRQKAELAELQTSKVELESIFDQLPDVVYRTNMQGIITMMSPSCFDILGYRQEIMIGTSLADYYETPEDRQKVVQAISSSSGKVARVEAGLKHKDGSVIWISTNAAVRYDTQGKAMFIEGVARDISDRKSMEDRLTSLSRTDALTEVYNRRYFLDKSEAVIEMMRRYKRPASLLMMDLDHFKNINDTYGHHVGDLALIAFTRVCRQESREPDVLGRLGGEEFGLMLPETTIQNAHILAERIRNVTAAIEIPVGDQAIMFTVSIGLVEIKDEDKSLDFVMRRADKAMYQAKGGGRNQVVTYL